MVLATPAAADPAPAVVVKEFGFTGHVETYVVPAGITAATVTVNGASGGTNVETPDVAGGSGAAVTGDLTARPGDTFTVGVGGQGGQNDGNRAPGEGGWASAPSYAGGSGGRSHGARPMDGSGGGGASILALNGQVVVVAGAGGGAGGEGSIGVGDYGGNAGDGNGNDGQRSYASQTGGRGGSAANPALDRTGGSETGHDLSGGGGGGGGGAFVGEGGTKSVQGGGGGGGGSSMHILTGAATTRAPYGNGSITLTLKGPAATIAGTPPQQYLGRTYAYAFTVGGQSTTTVTEGTLPPGLALDDAGTLSGVPTAAGTFAFTIVAANPISTARLATGITILPTAAPTISGTPPGASAGSPYRFQFQVTGTPYAVVTVAGAALPPGLSLDPATATLSGTPTTPGSFDFAVFATNGVPPEASLLVHLVVTPATVGTETMTSAPAPTSEPARASSDPSSPRPGARVAEAQDMDVLAATGPGVVLPGLALGLALIVLGIALVTVVRLRPRRSRR